MSIAVYTSSAPEVLEAFERGVQARHEYSQRLADAREAWGFPRDHVVWVRGTYAMGLAMIDPVPTGWRRNKDGRLIPDRRTTLGKAIDPQWQKLRKGVNARAALEPVGMPSFLFVGDWLCEPAVRRVGDTVWAHIGQDPDSDERGDKIGPLWRKVPLSEYYALVEAGSDPFAPTATAGATS